MPFVLNKLAWRAWPFGSSAVVLFAAMTCLFSGRSTAARFSVADDIGLSYFGVPNTFENALLWSPDREFCVVHTERGRLDINRPESTLRVYRMKDIQAFLRRPEGTRAPAPMWVVRRSTYTYGPIITQVRWLADSSGFAFLARAKTGNNELLLADLSKKDLHELSRDGRDVTSFSVRSTQDYVYSVLSPAVKEAAVAEASATSLVGTGRLLLDLLFPESASEIADRSDLWAVVNGKRFQVREATTKRGITLYRAGQAALALSPDGRFAVTALPMHVIPPEWEALYPPPMSASSSRIRAGTQDLEANYGAEYLSEYVLIDLIKGKVRQLVPAPLAQQVGWNSLPGADWSADGRLVVLSGSYAAEKPNLIGHVEGPCVTVVSVETGRSWCLEHIYGQTEAGYPPDWNLTSKVQFDPGSSRRVSVDQFYLTSGGFHRASAYEQAADGSWKRSNPALPTEQSNPVELSIRQGLNAPPVLIATEVASHISRVVLNPNPQLEGITLGKVSVLRWSDATGHEQVGGLYKPPDYLEGKRYPLVVQTHGFNENEFSASGAFPTATAAQELAGAGLLVLQARGSEGACASPNTPQEAPCEVANYEAAIQLLVSQGMVDPDRVGIVGFSRTCYHVLAALTTSKFRYSAASITDGINVGYFQYIMDVDMPEFGRDFESMIGARPFGKGLQRWLEQSPEFNMEKVTTPLQVVAIGKASLLSSWEPYAALRYLDKPVDLIVLNDEEHLLTNPAERMVSQGGTVDWFRFWLQDYEDPNPAKAAQYNRWRGLKRLRDRANHSSSGATSEVREF
jgi:Prolyl oligopeptidase family